MFRTPVSTAAAASLLLCAGVMTGCTNKTEGERTLERAQKIEDAGNMIRRGEQQIVDGRATEERGKALRDQGKTVEGDRLVNEGRAQQKAGQALVDQGRAAKN